MSSRQRKSIAGCCSSRTLARIPQKGLVKLLDNSPTDGETALLGRSRYHYRLDEGRRWSLRDEWTEEQVIELRVKLERDLLGIDEVLDRKADVEGSQGCR